MGLFIGSVSITGFIGSVFFTGFVTGFGSVTITGITGSIMMIISVRLQLFRKWRKGRPWLLPYPFAFSLILGFQLLCHPRRSPDSRLMLGWHWHWIMIRLCSIIIIIIHVIIITVVVNCNSWKEITLSSTVNSEQWMKLFTMFFLYIYTFTHFKMFFLHIYIFTMLFMNFLQLLQCFKLFKIFTMQFMKYLIFFQCY